jgi:catechol-2,3-dioxygenase
MGPVSDGGDLTGREYFGAEHDMSIHTKETTMLGNIDATANLAVKDLAVARRFYEDTLGLAQVDAEGDEVVVYRSGNTRINVYRSSSPAPTRRRP